MASLLFGCFSVNRVECEGAENTGKESSSASRKNDAVKGEKPVKNKSKKIRRSAAPVHVTYFLVGPGFSRL